MSKLVRKYLWAYHCRGSSLKCMAGCNRSITETNFHVGHNIPKSKGGGDDFENVFPICATCNLEMGTMTMDEYAEMKGRKLDLHVPLSKGLLLYADESDLEFGTLSADDRKRLCVYNDLPRNMSVGDTIKALSDLLNEIVSEPTINTNSNTGSDGSSDSLVNQQCWDVCLSTVNYLFDDTIYKVVSRIATRVDSKPINKVIRRDHTHFITSCCCGTWLLSDTLYTKSESE